MCRRRGARASGRARRFPKMQRRETAAATPSPRLGAYAKEPPPRHAAPAPDWARASDALAGGRPLADRKSANSWLARRKHIVPGFARVRTPAPERAVAAPLGGRISAREPRRMGRSQA